MAKRRHFDPSWCCDGRDLGIARLSKEGGCGGEALGEEVCRHRRPWTVSRACSESEPNCQYQALLSEHTMRLQKPTSSIAQISAPCCRDSQGIWPRRRHTRSISRIGSPPRPKSSRRGSPAKSWMLVSRWKSQLRLHLEVTKMRGCHRPYPCPCPWWWRWRPIVERRPGTLYDVLLHKGMEAVECKYGKLFLKSSFPLESQLTDKIRGRGRLLICDAGALDTIVRHFLWAS